MASKYYTGSDPVDFVKRLNLGMVEIDWSAFSNEMLAKIIDDIEGHIECGEVAAQERVARREKRGIVRLKK